MNPRYLQTYTGKLFDFANPKASAIDVKDIAHALSLEARYGGHTDKHYSVAHHAILVCDYLWSTTDSNPMWSFYGLHHDSAEAYLKDIPKPLKDMLPDYRALERAVSYELAVALDLPRNFHKHDMVKRAEIAVTRAEWEQFMVPIKENDWSAYFGDIQAAPIKIKPIKPFVAEAEFLYRHARLVTMLQGHGNHGAGATA